jgi:hypothetical protein
MFSMAASGMAVLPSLMMGVTSMGSQAIGVYTIVSRFDPSAIKFEP